MDKWDNYTAHTVGTPTPPTWKFREGTSESQALPLTRNLRQVKCMVGIAICRWPSNSLALFCLEIRVYNPCTHQSFEHVKNCSFILGCQHASFNIDMCPCGDSVTIHL